MTTIVRGQNILLTRNLVQSDGTTPLTYASLYSVTLSLVMDGAEVATYTAAASPAALRPGTNGTSLVLELTSDITAAFPTGTLEEHYTLSLADSSFVAEPTYSISVVKISDISVT